MLVDADGDAVGCGPSSATDVRLVLGGERTRSRASRALPASGTAAATAA